MADAAQLPALIAIVQRELDILMINVEGMPRDEVAAIRAKMCDVTRHRLGLVGAEFSDSIGGTEICLGGLCTRGATGLVQALACWIHFAGQLVATVPLLERSPTMPFLKRPTLAEYSVAYDLLWASIRERVPGFKPSGFLLPPTSADENPAAFGMMAAANLIVPGRGTPLAPMPTGGVYEECLCQALRLVNEEKVELRDPQGDGVGNWCRAHNEHDVVTQLIVRLLVARTAPANTASGETRSDAIAAASRLARKEALDDALAAIRALQPR